MILNTEKQQLNIIEDQAVRRISVVDLDLNGNDIYSDDSFVKIGYPAVKNKVMFWLNSLIGDVVRSNYSSPLIGLIGKSLNEDNIEAYTEMIRSSFNDAFGSEDIQLSNIELTTDPTVKTWKISLTVIDNITDSLIPIDIEVVQ